eukprot:scpid80327/ scgid3202/ 
MHVDYVIGVVLSAAVCALYAAFFLACLATLVHIRTQLDGSPVVSGFLCCIPSPGNSGVTAEQCAKDEFSCDKGGCLPRWYLCNGHVECPSPQDNSDETNCPSMLNCEGDGGVQCKHLNESRCWPQVYRCDNHTDCDGGEDEVGCDVWTMYLTETCRWSEWSECSLPTCNSQSRHPSPLSMQELLLAEFTDDWIPCSEANQTQSCVHVACTKKDGVGKQ